VNHLDQRKPRVRDPKFGLVLTAKTVVLIGRARLDRARSQTLSKSVYKRR
jgi:hypothetical protein